MKEYATPKYGRVKISFDSNDEYSITVIDAFNEEVEVPILKQDLESLRILLNKIL